MLIQVTLQNEIVKDFFIPFLIGLITLAAPLLFQTISSIDGKYGSKNLIELFFEEQVWFWCKFWLVFSILPIPIWYFSPSRYIDFGPSMNFFPDNFALGCFCIAVSGLFISTILLCYRIYCYYLPHLLIKRLIRKNNTEKENSNKKFSGICDLFLFSLRMKDQETIELGYSFFYNYVAKTSEKFKGKEVSFDPLFYNLLINGNDVICSEKRSENLEWMGAFFASLLLGNNLKGRHSKETFRALWICLIRIINENKLQDLQKYWVLAHQHAQSYDFDWNPDNEHQNPNLEFEKKKFVEFHLLIGSYIFFQKKNDLLLPIFNYSNSLPKRYYLFPSNLHTLIYSFFELVDTRDDPVYYESEYPFPQLIGIEKSYVIRGSLNRYIALHFIRICQEDSYNFGISRINLPAAPDNISTVNLWIDRFNILFKNIRELLMDPDTLNFFDLSPLPIQNEPETRKRIVDPIEICKDFKRKLDEKLNYLLDNLTVDEETVDEFNEDLKNAFQRNIKDFTFFELEVTEPKEKPTVIVAGVKHLMEVKDFGRDKTVRTYGADKALISNFITKLNFSISEFFSDHITSEFLVQEKDIFDLLGFAFAQGEYTIINCGVFLESYIHRFGVRELVKNPDGFTYVFMNTEIRRFPQVSYESGLHNSILIINNLDFPNVFYKSVEESERDLYGLKPVDESYGLYASLKELKLFDREVLNQLTPHELTERDILRLLFAKISINLQLFWKPNAKLYKIVPYNQHKHAGKPMPLEEAKGFFQETKG